MDEETREVELEFMLSWIENNPSLFVEKYNKFFDEYPSDEWEWHSVCRKGYLVLIAERRE